jgi:AraC-like DNA-binding protein
MSPLACRQLFGMPAAELATQVVELMDLFGTRGNELVEGLNASASWAARFETLDDVLVAGIRDVDGPSPEMRRTWQLIVHGGAGSRIAVIARDVGYSRRHLSTRFLQEFGVTPKTAVRVARFDRACELLDAGVPIARAAIQAGYDDHAHLASEWRDLSGMTPTAWLGDDLRDRAPREGDLRAASA